MSRLISKTSAILVFTTILYLSAPLLTFSQNDQRPRTVNPSRDLHPGIMQTKKAIEELDLVIAQESGASAKIIRKLTLKETENAVKKTNPNVKVLLEALDMAYSGYETGVAIAKHDWMTAISEGAKYLSRVVEQVLQDYPDPRSKVAGAGLKVARKSVDYAAMAVELVAIRHRLGELYQIRDELDQQYDNLQGKNVEATRAEWETIFRNLYGDPSTNQRAFREWLVRQNLDNQEIAAKAIQDAASISPTAASQIVRGITIIDPNQALWDVEKIPGINPDFIAALERCNNATAAFVSSGHTADYVAAMTCNKYADGSYIPAFGVSSSTSMNNRTGQVGAGTSSGARSTSNQDSISSRSELGISGTGESRHNYPPGKGGLLVRGSENIMYVVRDAAGNSSGSTITGHEIELVPGTYTVEIGCFKKQVVVQAGATTEVLETGKLLVRGSGNTMYFVHDAAGNGCGSAITGAEVELVPGTYTVEVGNVKRIVNIRAGQNTIM
jgi:hypothetical protein